MKFSEQFDEAVRAGFSGIWINSYEHQHILTEIEPVCDQQNWLACSWDPQNGTRVKGIDQSDPDLTALKALRTLDELGKAEFAKQQKSGSRTGGNGFFRVIMTMRNLHPALIGPDRRVANSVLLQTMQHVIERGAEIGAHVVVLGYPGIPIPVELEKMFYVINHNFPVKEELWDVLQLLSDPANPDRIPPRNSPEATLLLDAASGLTRFEAVGAYSLSLARKPNVLNPQIIWEIKEQTLLKSGLLTLRKPTFGFDMLGGLNHIKDFCLRAIRSPNRNATVQAKGVLAIGVPGSGKSAFCAALAKEVGWPCIELNAGSLMSGTVGSTEARTEQSLSMIDSMAPGILFLDEIEKMLAGAGAGSLDSGVSDRMFGRFLSWLNDHTSEIFVVASCNDISKLTEASKGAFTRAERFDGLFFFDLPNREQKDIIWSLWLTHYELDASQPRPVDKDWTGAEIRSCCRLAKLFDATIVETGKQIVPVAVTSESQITALKNFADKRYLSADYKGVYNKNGDPERRLMPATEVGRTRRMVSTKRAN